MSSPRWQLHHHTALVTGASTGIGRAIAAELLLLGADVLLVARDYGQLEGTRDELAIAHPQRKIDVFAADLVADDQRAELFDWIDDLGADLHVVVNNVGGNLKREVLEIATDDFDDLFELNVLSALDISRRAHPLLAQHPNSAIVNIGSVSGALHVRTGLLYGMTKAALHQMTRNLACEWAEDGIRVNAILPWYTRTRRTSTALADPEYYEEVINRTPMRRIAEPEEIAAAAAFLCLPAASYITGQCLAVDGGFLACGF